MIFGYLGGACSEQMFKKQWEGPEWSEAERSPPGVPSLPPLPILAANTQNPYSRALQLSWRQPFPAKNAFLLPPIHKNPILCILCGVAATQRAFPCKGECSYNRIHGPFSRGQTYYFTMPLKPMKARARMPTLMMAMGTPLKALGTSFRARCSRMPAKITMARP